jgi:hypothetical protein
MIAMTIDEGKLTQENLALRQVEGLKLMQGWEAREDIEEGEC